MRIAANWQNGFVRRFRPRLGAHNIALLAAPHIGLSTMHNWKLSLHTWTIDTTPLDVCLDATAKAGFDAIELRRSDFVQCYKKGLTRPQLVETIRESGTQLGILGTEYGWFFAAADEQRRLFDVLRESCEIAVELGCGMIMSAPGQLTGTLTDATAATRAAGEIVGEFGLRLALEFNSQHPVVNKTDALREIIAGAGQRNCGMLLDSYHLYRSQGIAKGLEGVTADELFVFQFSDVPQQPAQGVRRPVDRLAPGDGMIDWNDLFTRLDRIGYRGYLSYEAPNPLAWERSPYVVCAEGIEKTRLLLERWEKSRN
jgi:sugar phosphate isomerase/epimerase